MNYTTAELNDFLSRIPQLTTGLTAAESDIINLQTGVTAVSGTTTALSATTQALSTGLTAVTTRVGTIINHGTGQTSGYTLTPNDTHVWGEVASLDISSGMTLTDEYMVQFDSGATATTLTYPSTLIWQETPSVEANKRYLLAIIRGCAVIAGFPLS